MDHEGCSSGGMSAPTTYTFAFNDSNFSDRMLRIEVVAVSEKNDGDSTSARQKKRRRADRNTEAGSLGFVCLFRLCLPPFPRVQKLDDLVEVVMTSFTRVSIRLTAF